MKARIIFLMPLLVLGPTTHAGRFFVGGGASQIWIDSDHPAIEPQSATGYQITTGVMGKHLGLDLTVGGADIETGQVWDVYYPPDSASYGILDLSLKYYFANTDDARINPWIGAGVGMHWIAWDTYWYNVDGGSYSLCAGVDWRLVSRAYLRAGVKCHWFTSQDTYDYGPYDGKTVEADLGILWLFGDPLK